MAEWFSRYTIVALLLTTSLEAKNETGWFIHSLIRPSVAARNWENNANFEHRKHHISWLWTVDLKDHFWSEFSKQILNSSTTSALSYTSSWEASLKHKRKLYTTKI